MTSLASPPAEPETQKIRPTLATPFSHDQLEAHAVSLARAHRVELDPFSIDAFTVSNDRFASFVDATGHRTDAERFGWSFVFAGLLPDDTPPTRAMGS